MLSFYDSFLASKYRAVKICIEYVLFIMFYLFIFILYPLSYWKRRV